MYLLLLDVPVPALWELDELFHAPQHLPHHRQDQELLRQAESISRRGNRILKVFFSSNLKHTCWSEAVHIPTYNNLIIEEHELRRLPK